MIAMRGKLIMMSKVTQDLSLCSVILTVGDY